MNMISSRVPSRFFYTGCEDEGGDHSNGPDRTAWMLIRYDSRAVLEHCPGNLFSPGVLFVRWISARVQPFPVTSQPLRGAATHPLSPVPQQNRPLP
ncbi:hypothetical protein DPX16_3376 [Anabarilius grahami]|uniref:Uncharacterized protein n=1 Tax=Anabarilius grahami TaxID=495550 RepID=A0A3N0XLG6_ANAGA|nr:hypothetical protein DPX16_3376 [Anabarilius grahami]